MKVMHITYTGNFKEAYQRLVLDNGQENYYGQKYSVTTLVEGARAGINTLVLTLISEPHDSQLEQNLRSVGLSDTDQGPHPKDIEKAIEEFNPDKVILRTPNTRILRYLRKNKVEVLPILADSFEHTTNIKTRLRRLLLSKELRSKSINWVANHQINASRSLKNLGIHPSKILPYDWEHSNSPADWKKTPAKDISTKELRIFYAGALTEDKGLFDLFRGLAILNKRGRSFKLRAAGKGDNTACLAHAKSTKIIEYIELLGLIDHQSVLKEMNHADIVIVPSRHKYPEGLPMTIMESLMVHTPVIASDHPMFVGRVGKTDAVTFFSSPDARSLASQIFNLCKDYQHYKSCVEQAPREWDGLVIKLKWGDIINQWIKDSKTTVFSGYTLEDFDNSN